MKNTITTTSQSTQNYLIAADRIIELVDDLGFTSETKPDLQMIRHTVAQIIREAVEGNVNYSVGVNPEEEQVNLHELFESLSQENPCHCGCGCESQNNDLENE